VNYRKLTSKLNLRGKDLFFVFFILILGLAAIWSYFNLDQHVFSLLCQKPVNWNKSYWLEAFTYLGKAWLPIWLLLICFVSTGRQRPVLIAFLALIIVSLTVNPLKVSVKRPRPREIIKNRLEQNEQLNLLNHLSFPSGDTAVAFAVGTVVMSFVTWPMACLLLAACTGIALLRVTDMAHYPSDVFAGAAIGTFAGWLAIQIDRRWLPLERPRFNLSQGTSIMGIILIPLVFRLPKGIGKLVLFLKTYGLLVICILLTIKAKEHLKKIYATIKSGDSERFESVLNYLQERRTLALKLVFPIIIIENILDGEKPHELGIPDISIMAVIAVILVFTGVFIRLWSREHFTKGRLFATGPYALVRHPLYLGSFLIVCGVLFQLNDWFNWVVVVPVFTVFHGAAILYEERSLEKQFGQEWKLYKSTVPAIIPALRNARFVEQYHNWNWKFYLTTPELRAALWLLSLPLLIELMEDLVFEDMLGI